MGGKQCKCESSDTGCAPVNNTRTNGSKVTNFFKNPFSSTKTENDTTKKTGNDPTRSGNTKNNKNSKKPELNMKGGYKKKALKKITKKISKKLPKKKINKKKISKKLPKKKITKRSITKKSKK